MVIFVKDGCSRCETAVNYLVENEIPFKTLNTSQNNDANLLMWKKLEENKVSKTILMPVILNDNKLTHSHKGIVTFFKEIGNQK